jgi:hypothetical protein
MVTRRCPDCHRGNPSAFGRREARLNSGGTDRHVGGTAPVQCGAGWAVRYEVRGCEGPRFTVVGVARDVAGLRIADARLPAVTMPPDRG